MKTKKMTYKGPLGGVVLANGQELTRWEPMMVPAELVDILCKVRPEEFEEGDVKQPSTGKGKGKAAAKGGSNA